MCVWACVLGVEGQAGGEQVKGASQLFPQPQLPQGPEEACRRVGTKGYTAEQEGDVCADYRLWMAHACMCLWACAHTFQVKDVGEKRGGKG